MSRREGWVPRVVVCGTGFGRVYLSALRGAGMPFELVGILARGSARSQACAGYYQVPLYTDISQVPAADIACVVVNSGLNGGQGARLAQDLLASGLHVLQEHPLLGSELADCLRQARRSGVVYHLNTNYVHMDAVKCFTGAARRLLERQRPVFIDAISSLQVLYPLADILGQALGSVRPWSLAAVPPARPGDPAEILRAVNGLLGGTPATLRIQNQIHPGQRDAGPHLMHRVTIATSGGNLLLANSAGPVLWNPKLHMPADYQDAVSIETCEDGYLDLPTASCLFPAAASYRHVIGEAWPRAAGRALLELRRAIIAGEDPLPRGQYHLALCQLTADITGQLGRPEITPAIRPEIMRDSELARAESEGSPAQPSSQRSPAAR
jgi:thiazolinyl imide reductase